MGRQPSCTKEVAGAEEQPRMVPSAAGRTWLGLVLALALVRGLLYAAVVPPWQAPDETAHFEHAWLIAHLGRCPTGDDLSAAFEEDLLSSLYEWRYGEFVGRALPARAPTRIADLPCEVLAARSRTVGSRFSLGYVWTALFIRPLLDHDLVVQLYAARFASIILELAIVWLAWCTFAEMLPQRTRFVVASTAVVVFLPQHTFINATVGDGTAAEALACLVLYCWARLFRRGFGIWEAGVIAVATVGAVWSKATAAFLLPLEAFLGGWWLLRRRRGAWTRRAVGVAIGLATLALAAWLVARSPVGGRFGHLIAEWVDSPAIQGVDKRGMTLVQALLGSYNSFWAHFGWMNVPVSPALYFAFLALAVGSVLGWVFGSWATIPPPRWVSGMAWVVSATAAAVFVWTALLTQRSGYYQYQGRYLFPALVPFAFLLVGGWIRLLPSRWEHAVALAGVVLVILSDAWCLVLLVAPFYYQG